MINVNATAVFPIDENTLFAVYGIERAKATPLKWEKIVEEAKKNLLMIAPLSSIQDHYNLHDDAIKRIKYECARYTSYDLYDQHRPDILIVTYFAPNKAHVKSVWLETWVEPEGTEFAGLVDEKTYCLAFGKEGWLDESLSHNVKLDKHKYECLRDQHQGLVDHGEIKL